MESMNRARASRILSAYGVNDAGDLLAFKETKAYKLWVYEHGVVKEMGKRVFGWTLPEMGAAVFMLDNRVPAVAPLSHPAIVEGRRIHSIWMNSTRERAMAAYQQGLKA